MPSGKNSVLGRGRSLDPQKEQKFLATQTSVEAFKETPLHQTSNPQTSTETSVETSTAPLSPSLPPSTKSAQPLKEQVRDRLKSILEMKGGAVYWNVSVEEGIKKEGQKIRKEHEYPNDSLFVQDAIEFYIQYLRDLEKEV